MAIDTNGQSRSQGASLTKLPLQDACSIGNEGMPCLLSPATAQSPHNWLAMLVGSFTLVSILLSRWSPCTITSFPRTDFYYWYFSTYTWIIYYHRLPQIFARSGRCSKEMIMYRQRYHPNSHNLRDMSAVSNTTAALRSRRARLHILAVKEKEIPRHSAVTYWPVQQTARILWSVQLPIVASVAILHRIEFLIHWKWPIDHSNWVGDSIVHDHSARCLVHNTAPADGSVVTWKRAPP